MHTVAEKCLRTERMPFLFCQGCGNGTLLNLTARAIDELGIMNDVAMIGGVGCSSWIATYFKTDCFKTLHGRTLPTAIGLKLARPDKKIIVFVGDGDGVGIGGNHFIHAARKNIDLTVIMLNNNIYGMTGGQTAPTTPQGEKTATSPYGKIEPPIDPCRIAEAAGATYVARWTAAQPVQLKNAIKEAVRHPGFAFIEMVCACPTQAGLYLHRDREPVTTFNYIRDHCVPLQKAAVMSGEELEKSIVVGNFVREIRPEYCAEVEKQIAALHAERT